MMERKEMFMSTYSARQLGDRVVIIHDMRDQTVFSELDIEQADLLVEQLQTALMLATATLRETAFAA